MDVEHFGEDDDTLSRTVANPNQSFGSDFKELDEQIKSMMSLSQNMLSIPNGKRRASTCNACGKEGNYRNIKDHIEAYHIEGASLPCTFCGKMFKSRSALRHHRNNHK